SSSRTIKSQRGFWERARGRRTILGHNDRRNDLWKWRQPHHPQERRLGKDQSYFIRSKSFRRASLAVDAEADSETLLTGRVSFPRQTRLLSQLASESVST